jgi:hypothetical protein
MSSALPRCRASTLRGAGSKDHVRRGSDQFRFVAALAVDVVLAPAVSIRARASPHPEAAIGLIYSITSSARASNVGGTVIGGLEIDRQFVLDRCVHRQVGGLLALEDTIDVNRRFTVLLQPSFPDR